MLDTCAACGKESRDLREPPNADRYPYTRKNGKLIPRPTEYLCPDCLRPCSCKGGFAANCTCDSEYESYYDK